MDQEKRWATGEELFQAALTRQSLRRLQRPESRVQHEYLLLLYQPFIAAVHFADLNADFVQDAIALNDGNAWLESSAKGCLPAAIGGAAPCQGERASIIADLKQLTTSIFYETH